MKKFILILIICPFFAGAQNTNYSTDVQSQNQELEAARWRRQVRCGPHSDYKCMGRRVYDSCEKDSSHGYYGRCDNYGQRTPDVVCFCR